MLKNVCMDIGPGECHCITGPTGSGKSTLLLAIKGLLSGGKASGEISKLRPALSSASRIGIVLQNPETQILGSTIGTEMAFGLENLGVLPEQMEARIWPQLSAVGLKKPLACPVSDLSMGEKYRLILASVLVMAPYLILIDEPGAQLDESGIGQLKNILTGIKSSGRSIVLCEHRPDLFSGLIDTCWQVDEKKSLIPLKAAFQAKEPGPRPAKKNTAADRQENIVSVENLTPDVNSRHALWKDVSFSIKKGCRVGIYGPNGAGKTTLLRCMTGFVPTKKGTVLIFGKPPSPEHLRGKIGCLFQNPQKQLFENTVFEEVAFSLKRTTRYRNADEHVSCWLERMGLLHLGQASPHKLSFGQKHLVVLASILVTEPRLLILDDPYAGLDDYWKMWVTSILETALQDFDTTLIWCGHRADEKFPRPDMEMHINRGKIEIHH